MNADQHRFAAIHPSALGAPGDTFAGDNDTSSEAAKRHSFHPFLPLLEGVSPSRRSNDYAWRLLRRQLEGLEIS